MKKKLLFWVLTLTALLLMATSAQARIVASAPCPSCQVRARLSSAEGTHCVYTCDTCGEFTIYHSSHDWCYYCISLPECSFQSDVPNHDGTHSSGCALSLQSGEPCPNYGDVVIEDCSGGTATCTELAICESCGASYGALSDEHPNMSAWAFHDDSQHYRRCLICGSHQEYENHSGGTATCSAQAVCEVCSTQYGDYSTEHDISDWESRNDEQHYKYCTLCWDPETFIYEDHYGGTATCIGQAVCEVCGTQYGDLSTEHDISDWEPCTTEQHFKYCVLCWDQETLIFEDHYGGAATCSELAACEACGQLYGERSDVHVLSDWENISSKQHRKYCVLCVAPESFIYEDHYGGTATCAKQAICEACGESYGELDTVHSQMSQWSPSTTGGHFRYCRLCGAEDSMEFADHYDETGDGLCDACGDTMPCTHPNLSGWSPANSDQHSRYCTDCESLDSYEYENHYGGTATCGTYAICEGCGVPYGTTTGVHLNISDWAYYNSTQHLRFCEDCGYPETYEFESHYGGTATCAEQATCEGCGVRYGALSDEHPNMSSWVIPDGSQHYRECMTCGNHREYENHYGGTATCDEQAICEGCGARYGDYTEHDISDWEPATTKKHCKYCVLCMDEETYIFEDHYGGTATCIAPATCEVCGTRYGGFSTEHVLGDWGPHTDSQHQKYCVLCRNPESFIYEDHYGGTATCTERATCEGCGESYGELGDVHPQMSQWTRYSYKQHVRCCMQCASSDSYEYADHYDETGDGLCDACGAAPCTHSNMSRWSPVNSTQHSRYCSDCESPDSYEYENHYGGTATCFDPATCEGCGVRYGELSDEHPNMSNWFFSSDSQHYRWCLTCGSYQEYEDHYGGTATCADLATCEGCRSTYGELSTEHQWGEWEGFNDSQHVHHCSVCQVDGYASHQGGDGSCMPTCEDCDEVYYDPSGEHTSMTDWIHYNAKQHFRCCETCGTGYEYADHYGGTATCVQEAICEGCGARYGDIDPNNHTTYSEWQPESQTQHSRHCADCKSPSTYEYEDHYSSDTSCTPVCDSCKVSYFDLDGEHTMSAWHYSSDEQHFRYCTVCFQPDAFEYAAHTITTGVCASTCEDCSSIFYDPNGTHVGLTDWKYYDSNSHYRYCSACMDFDEYEEHSGGEADCSNRAICDVCGSAYGDFASDKHRWGEWSCFDSSVHLRTCAACSTTEGGAHTGGNGSCIPDCEHCGGRYIDANGEHRNMSQWFYVDAETHYRFCVDCGEYEETASHTGGKATCSALAVCDDCEEFYGDYDTDAHEWGEWLPDQNGMHVRICNLNSQHKEYAPCTWGDWTWLSDEYHVRECVDCGEKQTAAHTGGTATCSTPRICEVCNGGYGNPDDSGMTGHPNPTIEEKPGTCYDEGYYRITCNEPGCAMPFFEIILPANGQHLYNHWDVLGGNKHHTDCAQCNENADVACTLWELYEGEAPLSVCPICGDFAKALFEVLIARDDAAVPIGTLLVRGLADPIDGALFGFTVSGVYGGEIVDIHGPVTITIPVDCEGFTVVRVEIVDGAEVRTEIPFTLENGQLTIETATAGLFLLVPAE